MKIDQFSATREILVDAQIPLNGLFALVTLDLAKMPSRMVAVGITMAIFTKFWNRLWEGLCCPLRTNHLYKIIQKGSDRYGVICALRALWCLAFSARFDTGL